MIQGHSPLQTPSVPSQGFNDRLDRYQQLLKKLAQPVLTEVEIAEVLMYRDQLQAAMADRHALNSAHLIRIAELDHVLKKHEDVIARHLDLEVWRRLMNPPETAWWWFLQRPEPRQWWNEFDGLFNAGTLMALTISASLITDTATRLLTGGIDLGATLLISGQSLLALIAGGGALTQAGQEAYRRILERLTLNKRYWQEASFGFALILTLSLAGVHAMLPQFAESVHHSGADRLSVGKLDSARKHFQRAIALKPNYVEAHFNLAQVYEALQQTDQAKAEYQLVVRQKIEACQPADRENCDLSIWLQAHNNLARLDILDKKYNIAAPLLQAGLRQLSQQPVESNSEAQRLKYELLKNLGWARLNQSFFNEAENFLQDAIQTDSQTPDAFCLLAKLYDAQKAETRALTAWDQCLVLANRNPVVLETQPEVNEWAAMAQEKLSTSQAEP
jgi:tetratricopeptide (TPR) repeat protein